jgi:hypothetical protein
MTAPLDFDETVGKYRKYANLSVEGPQVASGATELATATVERAPTLDAADRQLLVDLLTSPAWQVLTEKVWKWQLNNLLHIILNTKDDIALKGEYHGLSSAATLASKFATPNLDFAAGTLAGEADLMARKRVTRHETPKI